MKYSKWHLNLALYIRKWVRNLQFNRKYTQYGSFTGPIVEFLELLLDIRHQETFSNTIPNKYARQDSRIINYHVPN